MRIRAAAVALAGCTVAAAVGCSSSSGSSPSGPPAPRPTDARTAALEHALLASTSAPRATTAACRNPATRPTNSPFGTDQQPLYLCRITVNGMPAAYFVEVRGNGCYVAERARAGQALYGCGARAAAAST